jgi:transglutaminase-like putative cysteine protease
MAFFLLIAGCALDPEASIGLVLAAFLVGSAWAFVMVQTQRESEANGNGALPDIVPLGVTSDSGPLAGSRGGAHSSSGKPAFAAAIAGLGVGCLVMTVGLFIVTPRMEAGFFGQGDLNLARTGSSIKVDLADEDIILLDPSPVMRVEFPDEPDGVYNGPLYWRVTSLDSYARGQWDSLGTSELQPDKPDGLAFWRTAPHRVERTPRNQEEFRKVRQRIYLDIIPPDGMPCLPYVQSLKGDSGQYQWDHRRDFTVHSPPRRSSLEYEVVSEVPNASSATLRAAPDSYRRVMRKGDFYILTNHGLEPQTVALARQITAGATTPYDKAVAIRDWFLKGDYVYSTEVPPLDRSRAVDAFVRETQIGHCQLYASAMVLLLRTQGIPCRIAKGFRGGKWNEQDRVYIVTNSMAHLWAEVYLIGIGWVPFDPSPAEPSSIDGFLARFSMAISVRALNAKYFWYRSIVGYQGTILDWQGLRNTGLRLLQLDFQGMRSTRRPRVAGPGAVGFWLQMVVLSTVLAAALTYLVRLRQNRPAGTNCVPLTQDQRRAVRVYRLLKRELRRYGLDCKGKTAEEILGETRDSGLINAGPVRRVVDAYNAVRFGGLPMNRSRYLRLTADVRSLRTANRA